MERRFGKEVADNIRRQGKRCFQTLPFDYGVFGRTLYVVNAVSEIKTNSRIIILTKRAIDAFRIIFRRSPEIEIKEEDGCCFLRIPNASFTLEGNLVIPFQQLEMNCGSTAGLYFFFNRIMPRAVIKLIADYHNCADEQMKCFSKREDYEDSSDEESAFAAGYGKRSKSPRPR